MAKTRSLPLRTIFDGATANGVGTAIEVSDFLNPSLILDVSGTATLTLKIQGSFSDTKPDFGAAQSATNSWDFAQVIELDGGEPVDGSTGYPLSGANLHKNVAINTQGYKWINAQISSRTAGTVTVKVKTFTND